MHEAWLIRACIRKGLVWCESRNPKPFVTEKIEGVHYHIAKDGL
jgi:hypothetical protein